MRTNEIIKDYNQKLWSDVNKFKNNPEFLKNLEKKIKEGKEQLTDYEGVICRDARSGVSTTQV